MVYNIMVQPCATFCDPTLHLVQCRPHSLVTMEIWMPVQRLGERHLPSRSHHLNVSTADSCSWTAEQHWDDGMNMGWIWDEYGWMADWYGWYMDWWCLGWLMSDDSSSHQQSSPNFIPRPWISSGNNLRSRPNARIGGVAGDHLGNSTSWNPANNGVWFYRDTIGLADRLCLINFNHF